MAYEMLLCEKDGPVVTITLNRPDALNALNPQIEGELHTALDEADQDGEVRAIILTGSGRAFSAGYDIAGPIKPGEPGHDDPADRDVGDFLQQWWMRDSGMKAFLDARDGPFLPEPFGPKSIVRKRQDRAADVEHTQAGG